MPEKSLPRPGEPHYSEAQVRRGVTLSWAEAFVIVPEIAEEALGKVFGELCDAKDELRRYHSALDSTSRRATNRAQNADLRLIEALRCLGTGDNDSAAHNVKMARQALDGGQPAE